jgi:spore coat protein U-like protein
LALLQGAGYARAATTGSTMAVSVTVNNSCSVSAAPMAFSTYVPGAGAILGATTVKVACTKSNPFNVGLGYGLTAGSSYTTRLLGNGANTLQYNLYTSGSHSIVWGDGSGSTQYVTGTGTGTATPVPLTVYGVLPDSAANQLAAGGTYSDTILVVIIY